MRHRSTARPSKAPGQSFAARRRSPLGPRQRLRRARIRARDGQARHPEPLSACIPTGNGRRASRPDHDGNGGTIDVPESIWRVFRATCERLADDRSNDRRAVAEDLTWGEPG